MTGRRDWKPPAIMTALAALLAGSVVLSLLGGVADDATGTAEPTPTPSPAATATPAPPEVTIAHETCCTQAARFFDVPWRSSAAVRSATVALAPSPPFECAATVADGGRDGRLGCSGFLAGATDYVATLTVTTEGGSYETAHQFRTMGDRLDDVQWFTEFEDPTGPPLACAAASCRIVQLFTTGDDKMTAEEILEFGMPFNRSRDPGLDPAAIATIMKRLDPRNDYHYYVHRTREEATAAAVYWLLRSGKPVIAITLAGQHAPVVVGFRGTYGTYYDDPANSITGMIVMDPQRGDLRAETNRRPDIYRAATFQTGHLLGMEEWLGHEWWLAFPYWSTDRSGVSMDRNDGVYPRPHWSGSYVIVVADGDSEHPSDLMGRVRYR
ncbi:MAG: hypothetical protein ACRDGE_06855 [Candidatus Limnocylindria bacterium]